MKGYIYAIVNTVNNKHYIGQTKNKLFKRKYQHFFMLRNNEHWSTHLQASWNRHGEENFKFITLYEHESDSPIHEFRQELDKLEVAFIQEYDSMKNGYNLTTGGKSCVVSDETREKLRCAMSGENNPFYGRKHKPGTFDKRVPWNMGMKGWRPGSVKDGFHQEETRKKIVSSTRKSKSNLTPEQAIEICERALAGERYADIATDFNTSTKVVCTIKQGARWGDVTEHLRNAN